MSRNYEIRKIHLEGEKGISRGITIPHKYLREIDLEQGDYVKIYLGEKGSNMLWLEKLQPPSVPAKKAVAVTEVAAQTPLPSSPTQQTEGAALQPNG